MPIKKPPGCERRLFFAQMDKVYVIALFNGLVEAVAEIVDPGVAVAGRADVFHY